MLINHLIAQQTSLNANRQMRPNTDVYAYLDAVNLDERVRQSVTWKRLLNWVRGRNPEHLLDLDEVKVQIRTTGMHYSGIYEVPLSQIRGILGRSRDFDAQFRPLASRVKERWLSIASAWYQGLGLPAVELVKVGEFYFVVDGNHRVSVANAMGKREIDAEVVEYQVAGPLPWEKPATNFANHPVAAI